ncbi:hypothetical protein KIF59_13755 [Enterobacter cloacae subsp. cloacae]|nr:hypothetical protein [Enterobacter cloacae subsp. cloacae]
MSWCWYGCESQPEQSPGCAGGSSSRRIWAGEPETRQAAAPACRTAAAKCRTCSQMQQADIQHMEFRDDRLWPQCRQTKGSRLRWFIWRARDAGNVQYRCRWWSPCMFPSGGATGAASGR